MKPVPIILGIFCVVVAVVAMYEKSMGWATILMLGGFVFLAWGGLIRFPVR